MQSFETKRKHVPGARDLVIQLKQISDGIAIIDSEIKQCQSRIHAIYDDERNASPYNKILNELKEAIEARDSVKNERKNYFNLNEDVKADLDRLKGERVSSNLGLNSIEKINKAIEDLEMKLISTSVTSKEETDISNSLINLKIQKSKFGMMESNIVQAEKLETTLREYKSNISRLSQQLNEMNALIDSLKAEQKTLTKGSRNKSPEVLKLEEKITALKDQKTDFFTQRTAKREQIHQLEVEFSKFEAELLIQKQLEEEKEVIRKTLNTLKFEKDSILGEQEAYNPRLFDTLIFTVEKLKSSKPFSLDIDLVTHLMKYNIKIPVSTDSLDETVKALEQKRNECQNTLRQKSTRLNSAIADLNAKIEAENAKLNALPPTNFDILKKAGFRGDFKNKA